MSEDVPEAHTSVYNHNLVRLKISPAEVVHGLQIYVGFSHDCRRRIPRDPPHLAVSYPVAQATAHRHIWIAELRSNDILGSNPQQIFRILSCSSDRRCPEYIWKEQYSLPRANHIFNLFQSKFLPPDIIIVVIGQGQ